MQKDLGHHLAGLDGTVAEIARELVERVAELNRRIKELETQIKLLLAEIAPSLPRSARLTGVRR
jgi:hypothetical protein